MVSRHEQRLMGNTFGFFAEHSDAKVAEKAILAAVSEIQRIEVMLSTFREDSETNAINRQAGIREVKVSAETFQLILRCNKLSVLTQGAFDLSYGSLDKSLWNFDRSMKNLPDPRLAKKMVHLINYKNILLNPEDQSVMLLKKGMRIGFGGIGKGYAADKAAKVMQGLGIQRGFVSASGDINCWNPKGRKWNVALEVPEFRHHVLGELEISNYAVATSGNYEKCVTIDGVRYSHTIDPKTGFPAKAMKSVTVIAPYAELADAICTPLMIMGASVGLNMVDQLKGVAAIIIDQKDCIHTSKNIRSYVQN